MMKDLMGCLFTVFRLFFFGDQIHVKILTKA